MSQDFTWSAMKRPTPLFWRLHEVGEHPHHAAVDLGADRRIVRELAADIDQHGLELPPNLAVGRTRVLLEEAAQALPGALGHGRDLRPRQQVALQPFGTTREGIARCAGGR